MPDLRGHIREQGLPELRSPVPVGAFLGAPIVRGGLRMGNIFLARGEGSGEFGREDEETLVMFASQAALVIANARLHREEQRARADLETSGGHHPGGRGGLRRHQRDGEVAEPGGEAHSGGLCSPPTGRWSGY